MFQKTSEDLSFLLTLCIIVFKHLIHENCSLCVPFFSIVANLPVQNTFVTFVFLSLCFYVGGRLNSSMLFIYTVPHSFKKIYILFN